MRGATKAKVSASPSLPTSMLQSNGNNGTNIKHPSPPNATLYGGYPSIAPPHNRECSSSKLGSKPTLHIQYHAILSSVPLPRYRAKQRARAYYTDPTTTIGSLDRGIISNVAIAIGKTLWQVTGG